MIEKTFAVLKPDAVLANITGMIIYLIELNKFEIINMRKTQLTKELAQEFYAIHKERPFFNELVEYMTSGPVIVMMLQKENCVQEWRDLMGATDPLKAAPGTIRKMFGKSIGSNATHGSDSVENAKIELDLFFK